MWRVCDGIYVGSLADCQLSPQGWAVVHACKHPCHRDVVGVVNPDHEHYLSYERGLHLYLNLIDPPTPLFKLESFVTALGFIKSQWQAHRNTLIHCNKGQSRAPALALLFLASALGLVSNASYDDAAVEFRSIYPAYEPGLGIETFLREQWLVLMAV